MDTVECPRLLLLMDGYGINTENRSAGTEVAVTCYGRQLVTVKCEEDGVWNGTIPPCTQDFRQRSEVSTVAQGIDADSNNVNAVVIIVWVLGGLLLFSLIVLIIVVINSRKKSTDSPNSARDSRSGIFSISHTGRQSRGGDNPAFCGADESSSNDRPLRRSSPIRVSQGRPPSYQEAMSGRIISIPLPGSPQRSNNSTSNGRGRRQREANRHDPQAARRGQSLGPPPHYTFEYTSFFWEDEPPPPYSVGAFGVVRAMGGPRDISQERQRSSATQGSARNPSPIVGRAPLAVPTPTVLSPEPSPRPPPRNQQEQAPAREDQAQNHNQGQGHTHGRDQNDTQGRNVAHVQTSQGQRSGRCQNQSRNDTQGVAQQQNVTQGQNHLLNGQAQNTVCVQGQTSGQHNLQNSQSHNGASIQGQRSGQNHIQNSQSQNGGSIQGQRSGHFSDLERYQHTPLPFASFHGNVPPLASSSPVPPRHQRTPSAPPVDILPIRREDIGRRSEGNGRAVHLSPALPRTRVGSCRGFAGYHDDGRLFRVGRLEPSAPLARLDCDYF